MIRVERVLMAKLLATGMSRDDVSVLAHLALHDRTARRLLSATARGTVTYGMDWPLDDRGRPDRSWTGEPVAMATVELGPGLGWNGGRLYDPKGVIPLTLAAAAVGRPSRDVLLHPDIDPDLLVQPTVADARIRFHMETVRLARPLSPWPWLRALRRIADRRSHDTRTPARIKLALVFAAAVTITSACNRRLYDQPGTLYVAGSILMIVAASTMTFMAVDALGGRWLTQWIMHRLGKETLFDMNGDGDARVEQDRENLRRGFDDAGHPFG